MPYKGGRRKKSRTHREPGPEAGDKPPSSLIIRRGRVTATVKELVHDLRRVMLPHTAPKLKERRSNALRDFVSVAGPLGVSHLVMLSHTHTKTRKLDNTTHVNMRVARMPQGPTVTFRVERYTLARQVKSSQATPVEIAEAFEHPPLLVMHGMGAASASSAPGGRVEMDASTGVSAGEALKMVQAIFQNMFPSLDPAAVKLSSCRRVLLLAVKDASPAGRSAPCVEVRHFIIRATPTGLSQPIKRIVTGREIPDLSSLAHISDYVLGATGDGAAASTHDGDEDAAKVTLPADYAGRGNIAARQSAIKLSEIGPRLSLSVRKIEEGVCEGEVLFHAAIRRTPTELAALRSAAEKKRQLREERTRTQELNVARKEAAASAKRDAKAERKRARQAAAQSDAVRDASRGVLGDEDDAEDAYDDHDEREEAEDGGDGMGEGHVEAESEGMDADDGEDDDDDELDEDEEPEDDDEDEEPAPAPARASASARGHKAAARPARSRPATAAPAAAGKRRRG